MNKKLDCIMLVDDNADDNFFHERAIKKINLAITVLTQSSGVKALEYLKSEEDKNRDPDLIFLDINMPGMSGWEFLQEYNRINKELQKQVIIIMLTTSDNPDDAARAGKYSFVSDYITKPLTKETMEGIINKYFQ